uniref:Amidohydrolase 3 domain-containing protein n=1 Tax=Pyrodinium bahamense TaxID=73915 RepID=A0A7S0AFP0_9DINO
MADVGPPPTLVIRGGTVVDGTGAPPFVADVAVRGRTIAAVGKDLPAEGAREVNARGLLVTPGWVDPHTHYDAQMLWDPYFSPSTNNGVSTLVIGNCGVGIAPCQESMRDFLTDICDAVENIPAAAVKEKVKWEWETFPEYLATLEKLPFACDVGVLVGHSAVRTWVMGPRANLPDRPGSTAKVSQEEIESMSKVVEEAVAAGALGFSASRVGLHRDTKGVLTPGSLATPEEMVALGAGIVRGGGGVFELASDWTLYDDVQQKDWKKVAEHQKQDWKWIGQVATMSPDKLLFTTGMGTGMTPESAYEHRGFLGAMEKIAAQGGKMMGTPMMRLGFLTFNLSSGVHPFTLSRTYRRLKKQAGSSIDALAESMADPANRAAIIEETNKAGEKHPGHGLFNIVLDAPRFLWPWSPDPEPKIEDSLGARAEREGKPLLELAYDVLSRPRAPHGGVLWKALYNYGSGDLEPLREMLCHQQVVPGFADGGAHMMVQCEATTPTTMLTHWVRDRTRGEKLPLEMVVRKQTAESAVMMGLHDRGELRPGMKADLNLIDFDALRVLPPEFRHDLPLGAGRWVQAVEGYRMTVVSGEVVYEDGRPTGALPGALVRNPRSVGLQGSLRGSVPAAGEAAMADSLDLSEHALKLASQQGVGMSGVQRALRGSEPPKSRL